VGLTHSPDQWGNLTAPPGSHAWVLAVRIQLHLLMDALQTDLQQIGTSLRTLAVTHGYRHVDTAAGTPFASLQAFVTTPRPYGLGYDHARPASIITALQGLLGPQPASPDVPSLPEPLCPAPSA